VPIQKVQFDTLPPLKEWLFEGSCAEYGRAIDVSDINTTVRAHIKFNGTWKESIYCAKAPGLFKGVDKRSSLWIVDEAAPYNTPGKGGIVLTYPTPNTWDQVGIYEIEYEIVSSGGRQTVKAGQQIEVIPQIN
jgi:hypothetical protein